MTSALCFKARVGKPWLRASLPASDEFLRFKHLPTITEGRSPFLFTTQPLVTEYNSLHFNTGENSTQIVDEFDKRKVMDSELIFT